MHIDNNELKSEVREFWDRLSCGEVYAAGMSEKERFEAQGKARYELEPHIHDFARFHEGQGKDVLEIGVGMGADHIEWAKTGPKSLTGIDLTPRAVRHTENRLNIYGLKSDVRVADAERLPFPSNHFDIVWSYGVLHHSPDTEGAVREAYRVLRPGGIAKIMIYHKYSITGYILWARYGLMRGRPFVRLEDIYRDYLESPGTKAFSIPEARRIFTEFSHADFNIRFGLGDLMLGEAGQRHKGPALKIAKKIWPRFLIGKLLKNHGLHLLIHAVK